MRFYELVLHALLATEKCLYAQPLPGLGAFMTFCKSQGRLTNGIAFLMGYHHRAHIRFQSGIYYIHICTYLYICIHEDELIIVVKRISLKSLEPSPQLLIWKYYICFARLKKLSQNWIKNCHLCNIEFVYLNYKHLRSAQITPMISCIPVRLIVFHLRWCAWLRSYRLN